MTPAQPAGDPRLDPPRSDVRVHVDISARPIDVGQAHDAVADPEAGAIGVFSGVVRDHHDGEAVVGITYEAWEERAPAALRSVAEEVARRHRGVRAVHVVHRIGSLRVGEVSIVCAVAAPHRAEALAAVGDLIDLVKERVPIWKREELVDGRIAWPGTDGPGPTR